jgi:hypothetical protein
MQKEKVYSERLKFYADTPKESNKYFCWETSILGLKETLYRFYDKGWNIRSAWYEKIDLSTGEVMENTRLNLQPILEEYLDKKLSVKRKNLH